MTMRQAKDRHPDHNARRSTAELIDPRYARLVGGAAWAKLPASIRKRFSARLVRGQTKLYAGRVEYTRLSRAGFLFAQVLRVVGAPLPLQRSEGGESAIVTVTDDPDAAGQIWTRQYSRERGFPQVVFSTKRFQGPTGCEEWVHPCIGMRLQVSAAEDRLRFDSERYLIRLFGKRLALPSGLTPGRLCVEHIDLGRGQFRFTLRLTHKVFGALLDQSLIFEDMEAAL